MPKEDATELLSINGREVRVTNSGKLYFSKQTKLSKLDLVRYYLSVAPGALTGIRDRPLVLDLHHSAQDPLLQMYRLGPLAKTGRSRVRQRPLRAPGSPRSNRVE